MILDLTKPALLGLLFLFQLQSPLRDPVKHFRFQRAVKLSSSGPAQTCAVLDADVFAHSAPSLKDLRLYSGQTEIPYVTTLSEPLQQESEEARIFNLRARSGHIFFDLDMPRRPYTGINLEIAARDYLAEATVSGSTAADGKKTIPLGTFSIFDLANQHLSRISSVPLLESTFPYLHVELTFTSAPGSNTPFSLFKVPAIVKSVTVPPSREAQSVYTTTQQAQAGQQGQDTIATFEVRSRIPVERIAFTLPSTYRGSFSRTVRIEARRTSSRDPERASNQSEAPVPPETVTGRILRVHKSEAGRRISAEELSVPVSIGSNMQQPAFMEVKVENGPDAPLPLTVELQMRQRRICFDAPGVPTTAAPLELYYGDPSLNSPTYKEATLERAAENPQVAELQPETENAAFIGGETARKLNQPRPILRWLALLGCVCIFALLVIRSTHRQRTE